ncbi:MAG: RidA family protein [Pseudomonadota bacterium]
MMKTIIQTEKAPKAIGTYSQAVRVDKTLYLSGQIPLVPETMVMISEDISEQIHQVFKNLQAVLEAGNSSFVNIAKLNIYLTDLQNFGRVNEIMSEYFSEPYPARAAVGVRELPKGALVEMDAIAVCN